MRIHSKLETRNSKPPRGVALLLALFAVIIAVTLSASFLTSQSTTLGIARNLQNGAQARYVAESGMELTIAYVRSSATWRTDRPNGTWVTDTPFAPGTFTVMGEDGRDTDGDGDVDGDGDLTDDDSEPVTLTITGKVGGAASVVRAVVTSQPQGDGVLTYGEQNQSYVRYREWTGSAWSPELSAGNVGSNPKWYVARYCPTLDQVAVCTLNNADDLEIQFRVVSTWTTSPTMLTDNAAGSGARPYDLAYEQLSGRLLIAYRVGNDGLLHYRTATGGTLSAESTYTLPTNGNLRWVRLVSKQGSNEILLLTLDGKKDIAAAVWNGTAWTQSILLENDAEAVGNELMAGVYEGQSGRAIVVWSQKNQPIFQYRTWSGVAWSGEANGSSLGVEAQWMKMASDPASNQVILGTLDSASDIKLIRWSGSGWGTPLTVETSAPNSDRRCFDVAFMGSGGNALAVWGRSAQNNCFYRTWNGSSWSSEQTGPGLTDKVSWVQMVTDAGTGRIFVNVLQKGSGALQAMLWNGSSLSAATQVESSCSGPNDTESFMLAFRAEAAGGGASSYTVQWIEAP